MRRDRSGHGRKQESRGSAYTGALTSVIIGLAGLLATAVYNYGQLEIARTKEIASVIDQLTSTESRKQVVASAVLGLYGDDAIPALLALLRNSDRDVAEAARSSLIQIGEAAREAVIKGFCERPRRLTEYATGLALGVVGRLGGNECDGLIARILADEMEVPRIRIDAIEAACDLENRKFLPAIATIARKGADLDSGLAYWAAWCVGEFGEAQYAADVLALVEHAEPDTRFWAYRALRKLKDPALAERLCAAAESEKSRPGTTDSLQEDARRLCPTGTPR